MSVTAIVSIAVIIDTIYYAPGIGNHEINAFASHLLTHILIVPDSCMWSKMAEDTNDVHIQISEESR